MKSTPDVCGARLQRIGLSVLLGSCLGAPATHAAPVSVYGVGHSTTPPFAAEMYHFNESGPLLQQWGILGPGLGVSMTAYGTNLYVAGFGGPINRYDLQGQFLGQFADVHAIAGSRPGDQRLETDSQGNVYISYAGQLYESRTSFRLNSDGSVSASFSHADLVFPSGIDATTTGDVYIVNSANVGIGDALFRFSADGQYLGNFSIPETEHPSDIAINEEANELYIADWMGKSINIYDISNGVPIFRAELPTPGNTSDVFVEPKSKRIFGTYRITSYYAGFEISRGGDLIATYVEDAVPGEQRVLGIAAVAFIPEPASALLLVTSIVGLCLRNRGIRHSTALCQM